MNAVTLHCTFYDFVRIQRLLRITPSMAAGIADWLRGIQNIAALGERPKPELPRKWAARTSPALSRPPSQTRALPKRLYFAVTSGERRRTATEEGLQIYMASAALSIIAGPRRAC
jgi:hypothetical protein